MHGSRPPPWREPTPPQPSASRSRSAGTSRSRAISIVRQMTATLPGEQDSDLAAARWDLEPLVEGRGKEGALAQLDEAQRLADAFAETYRGKVAGLDAAGVAGAMRELETLFDLVGRAGSYASLWFTVDTDDPE